MTGLSLTAANYQEAIDILKKRFGDDSRIITRHMEAFTSLEAVTDDRDLQALRRIYDKIEIDVSGLNSLGVAHDAYGALLTPLMMKKLPPKLRVIISHKMTGKEWEFHSILEVALVECKGKHHPSTCKKENEEAKKEGQSETQPSSEIVNSQS